MTSPPSRQDEHPGLGAAPNPKEVRVHVIASETIADGGTRKTSWLVLYQSRWISARDFPGAELERMDPAPGTVWRSSATLLLPVGSWIQRVDTTPNPGRFTDPLRYLQQQRRSVSRRVTRTYFRVTATGKLKRQDRGVTPP